MVYLCLLNASFLPQSLINVDKSLFHKVNGEWYNGFLDGIMPYIREPFFWTPFYVFMILFVLINFKLKGWMWMAFILLTVTISDYTSSSLIKEYFFRLRPCRDPDVAHSIRFIVGYCPISSSFVSSHAVNHFALATFIFVTFRKAISRRWVFIFLWAAAIAYAQVYVGVHYPVDVVCGSLYGILIGYLVSLAFNRLIGLEIKEKIE